MKQIITIKLTILFISAVMLLFSTSSYASSNFITVMLPKGVSIELPKNWLVATKTERITLDSLVESKLDLAGIDQDASEFTFAANYYRNGKTVGIINNRYYSDLEFTQTDAQQISVKEFDAALKDSMVENMLAIGVSILSWEGTKRTTINGITALVTEYHRKSLVGPEAFRVRLIRVIAGKRSFTLTVSYNEKDSFFLETITDRIISSLKLTGINKAPADTSKASSNVTSITNSVMSSTYGDSWGYTLVVSALFTWGIGLTPPLLIRFLLLRRPISKGWAISTAAIFLFINIILFTALGSTSKVHTALALVAWASYAILRKGHRKIPKATT